MDTHIRVLGWLNMIFGALAFVVSAFVLYNAGGFSGLSSSFNEEIYGYVAVASIVFHLLISIPCFLGGLLILRLMDSARTMLILVSALNTLNAPVGTMLGAYGLWVLMMPETEPLFANAPAQNKRKKKKKLPAAKSAPSSSSTVAAPGDLSSK